MHRLPPRSASGSSAGSPDFLSALSSEKSILIFEEGKKYNSFYKRRSIPLGDPSLQTLQTYGSREKSEVYSYCFSLNPIVPKVDSTISISSHIQWGTFSKNFQNKKKTFWKKIQTQTFVSLSFHQKNPCKFSHQTIQLLLIFLSLFFVIQRLWILKL